MAPSPPRPSSPLVPARPSSSIVPGAAPVPPHIAASPRRRGRSAARAGRVGAALAGAAVLALAACSSSTGTTSSATSVTAVTTTTPTTYTSIADLQKALEGKGITCKLEYPGLRDDTAQTELSICVIDGEQAFLKIWLKPDQIKEFLASPDGQTGTVAVGANWTITLSTPAAAAKVAQAIGGTAAGPSGSGSAGSSGSGGSSGSTPGSR